MNDDYLYVLEYSSANILEIEVSEEYSELDCEEILIKHGYKPSDCAWMRVGVKLDITKIKD